MEWDALLMNALRAGLGVEEFWSLTPRETGMALEARAWRMERETERTTELIRLAQKLAGWLAWHTAALQRSRNMPSLQRLLGGGQTKELTPDEARERKAEFEEMWRAVGTRKPRKAMKGHESPHPGPLPGGEGGE